jgi:putative membrane protein
MMGEYGQGWTLGWWWIVALLIVVAVVWIVVKSMNRKSTTSQNSKKTALEILKKRYAEGKIDHQEFEKRKKDLTQ